MYLLWLYFPELYSQPMRRYPGDSCADMLGLFEKYNGKQTIIYAVAIQHLDCLKNIMGSKL